MEKMFLNKLVNILVLLLTSWPRLQLFVWKTKGVMGEAEGKVKVKQSRYRPRVAQRLPGS
jgi:hypothetical protein